MTILSSNVRSQVLAQIITVMEGAIDVGADPDQAVEAAFPGVPSDVIVLAEMELADRRMEAWWRTIERTIDQALIEKAMLGASENGTPAGSRDQFLDEAFSAIFED